MKNKLHILTVGAGLGEDFLRVTKFGSYDQKRWVATRSPPGGPALTPYEKKLGRDVYELLVSPSESREVHADQIKKYHWEDPPEGGVPLYYDHTDPPNRSPREVERIREHRKTGQGWQFLVHWKGAPVSQDSWEFPTSFLTLTSQVWVDYCEHHRLFTDLQGIPALKGIYPRVAPWEESLLQPHARDRHED